MTKEIAYIGLGSNLATPEVTDKHGTKCYHCFAGSV
ncbi:hypothetical protein BMETH_140_1 [methanotrophic bacterial endosymbiont of Bathymodiolus sp.]|nr:hypothetical protein BMETH_140_1 [methanotrophic bacterial endosymbiont of Bathymodiolus sp.]